MSEFKEVLTQRFSCYGVGKNTELSALDVSNKLQEVTALVPSAFNSQTTRVVVLGEEKNKQLWDLIAATQKQVLPAEVYEQMAGGFTAATQGLGTILIFEDRESVETMPTSPARQEVYKEQNSAMIAYAVWLALTELGLGASLQHFNIGHKAGYDKAILDLLSLPETYELMAEMPFGSIEAEREKKAKIDPEQVVQFQA